MEKIALIIAELEALLENSVEADTADAEALTDTDNAYNEGWQNGTRNALTVLKKYV